MLNAKQVVETLFEAQAQNYSCQSASSLLSHYAPEEELLFWGSEGARINSHSALRLWYESLFSQFEILSVTYRIEKIWSHDQQISIASLWQFETRLREVDDAMVELQCLKATHILIPIDGEWKISHLHSSPVAHSAFE